jgi:two-component system sensor histidine kinase KdpD
VIPSLAALLAATLDREALEAQLVESRALRRSDEIKTAVLRAVSHDLRSPLTAILAAAEALDSPSATVEERHELARAVVEEAGRLSALVDKLLDMSRLEAGVARPRRDWASLEEVVRAAVDGLGAADGAVRIAVAPGLPLLEVDGAQLERALANLIENALRYSDGRPVQVRAGVVRKRVVLRIVDAGPGIAPEDAKRIFEPFYRGAQAPGRHTGSGLGLAVARGLIEANGGAIAVESTPGHGATFVVTFPVAAGEHGAAAEEPREGAGAR